MAKGIATSQDLEQMYTNSLVMYKNKPYYIYNVSGMKVARCLNITTQKVEEIDINEIDFTAPARRMGFVNTEKGCFYMSRIPVRRYKVGLSKDNILCQAIGGANYPNGANPVMGRLKELTAVEISATIFNKFPTIAEAYNRCVEHNNPVVAFDRQFAIGRDGHVYYKLSRIGCIDKVPKNNSDIVFSDGFEHLAILLDNNHEKSLSSSRS